MKTVKHLGEGIVVDFSPFVPGGPFTPGWPYSPATCPACQGIAAPASRLRQSATMVLNSVRTLTMNAASIASGGDVQQNVVKNVVNGNEVGSPTASRTFRLLKQGCTRRAHRSRSPTRRPRRHVGHVDQCD